VVSFGYVKKSDALPSDTARKTFVFSVRLLVVKQNLKAMLICWLTLMPQRKQVRGFRLV
jgi:hypothetical protein